MVLRSNEEGIANVNNKNTALDISTSRKALLDSENPKLEKQEKLKVIPTRLSLLKFNSDNSFPSPSAKFRQIAAERDEISRSVPSSMSQVLQKRINVIISKKIDMKLFCKIFKTWIKKPFNMALFIWISCVAISGAILFLVMTGMLNHALPQKTQRDTWFEVNNQILNALFTLMCLYQHPKRFHHLVLLCRWTVNDITTLRKIYCKNGTYKPHEWAHMMVVVLLLHINCFAQYALCGLNLGYRRSERPAIGVGICLSVSFGASAIAGVYSIISSLGRDYDSLELDEEAQNQTVTSNSSHRISSEKRFSNEQPKWIGGLFDIWDDMAVAYLSLFCGFCMFGYNMERLGFGNMYVHIATFLLLCIAPFWIFNLAAVNIDNEVVREALGLTGIALCLFGLLYGGFWRVQMRKRFNLPKNEFCGCFKADVADCLMWLFCCWCSLAQETRTVDFYDIVEKNESTLLPLPHDRVVEFRYRGISPSPSRFSKEAGVMEPPVIASIQVEEFAKKNVDREK